MAERRIQVDKDDLAVADDIRQIAFDAVLLNGGKQSKSKLPAKFRDPSKTKGEARMPGLPLGCVALDSKA